MLTVLIACSSKNGPLSQEVSTPVTSQTAFSPTPNPITMLPTVKDPMCCLGGVPDTHPAPLGYAVPLGDGRLVVGVLEVTRPANDIITEASPSNPAPPAGWEYLIVKVIVQCIADDSNTDNPCDLGLGVLFRVIDSTGTYHEEAPELAEVPDQFELPSNINTAFTTTGNVVFLVPTSESDLVLNFSWPNNAHVLLALY